MQNSPNITRRLCKNCGATYYVPNGFENDEIRGNFCCVWCAREYAHKQEMRQRIAAERARRQIRKEKFEQLARRNTNQGVKRLGKTFLPRIK
jgi:hypothetical protein